MILIEILSSTPVREPTERELRGRESECPEPNPGNQDRGDAGIPQTGGREGRGADYLRQYFTDKMRVRLTLPSLMQLK